jgi:hypothetical protein
MGHAYVVPVRHLRTNLCNPGTRTQVLVLIEASERQILDRSTHDIAFSGLPSKFESSKPGLTYATHNNTLQNTEPVLLTRHDRLPLCSLRRTT